MGKGAKIYRRPCVRNAFAGTTLMLSYAPPAIAQRGRNVPSNPAPDIGGKKRRKQRQK
jgi:hypothetical protein